MIDFFKSRKYGTFVDEVYILGGGAHLKDFINILTDEIGINVSRVINPGYEAISDTAFDQIFNNFDTDHSGTVDREEMVDFIKTLYGYK